MSRRAETYFSIGDLVEVTRPKGGLIGPFYAATVLPSPAKDETHVWVEYHTLLQSDTRPASVLLKELVHLDRVRPTPPQSDLNRRFSVGDTVDGHYEFGWHRGLVLEVFHNSVYSVMLEDACKRLRFEQFLLRVHRDWVDGSWSPPLPDQNSEKKLTGENVKTGKRRVKVKSNRKMPVAKFMEGEMVEVSSDEEGYPGSWYTATLVEFMDSDKLLVEYLTPKAGIETSPVREEVNVKRVRPNPPPIPIFTSYSLHEEVDAWYNDRWWVGVVSEILDRNKYFVSFSSTSERMEFTRCNLRSHRDWFDGEWVSPKMQKRSREFEPKCVDVKMKKRGRKSESSAVRFNEEMLVDVRSDVEGYQGSWFAATIAKAIDNGKYLVEYETLLTNDEAGLLKEEAHGNDIRPRAPNIEVARFELHDKVDAWSNDGWWVGEISSILEEGNYMVYFRGTEEKTEVKHCDLRPHLEWMHRQWFDASKGLIQS